MSDALARILRTGMQIVAAGGLTWLTDQLAKDLPPAYVPYLLGTYTLIVAICQNLIEEQTGHAALRQPRTRVTAGPAPASSPGDADR